MAVAAGVTEIADSEEEPLTSSSALVSDESVDKLSATARQDTGDLACPHQAPAKRIADEASGYTRGLDGHQEEPAPIIKASQIDHVDSQSAHQPNTNIDNNLTTKDQVRAAASPNVSHAELPSNSVDADEANATNSTLQQTERDDENAIATQHDDRSTALPAATPLDFSASQDDERQVGSPDPSLASHVHEHVQQSNAPSECSSMLYAPNKAHDRLMETQHLHNDSARRTTPGTAVKGVVQGQGDARGEHSAGEPLRGIDSEAAVKVPVATTADCSSLVMDAGSSTAHTQGFWNLDYAPVSTNTPVFSAESAIDADNAAAITPKTHHDCGAVLSSQQVHNTEAMATTHTLTNHGPAVVTDDKDFSKSGPLRNIAEAQNVAAPAHVTHHDRRVSNGVQTEIGTKGMATNIDTSEQVPAVLLAEPGPEGPRVLAEEGAEPTKQISETPASSKSEATGLHDTDDAKMEIDPSPASTAAASQPQLQPTASQASEPTLPRPAAKLTPQEITLAELKAQKAALLASLVALPAIQVLIEENQCSDIDMSDDDGEPTDADTMAAANKMVKEHIKLLHEYNELKDVGQGLMGLIADQRGVRIVEVQDEFGIDAED